MQMEHRAVKLANVECVQNICTVWKIDRCLSASPWSGSKSAAETLCWQSTPPGRIRTYTCYRSCRNLLAAAQALDLTYFGCLGSRCLQHQVCVLWVLSIQFWIKHKSLSALLSTLLLGWMQGCQSFKFKQGANQILPSACEGCFSAGVCVADSKASSWSSKKSPRLKEIFFTGLPQVEWIWSTPWRAISLILASIIKPSLISPLLPLSAGEFSRPIKLVRLCRILPLPCKKDRLYWGLVLCFAFSTWSIFPWIIKRVHSGSKSKSHLPWIHKSGEIHARRKLLPEGCFALE